jgi:hypothetical protein
MKCAVALLLAFGLAHAAPARALSMRAPNPPFPQTWIARGVCPSECCAYRRWSARRALPVYAVEGRADRPAFTIARGDSFDALTGNVHVTRTGIARILRSFVIPEEHGRLIALAGERFALFEYDGEDSWHAWLHGSECWIDVDWLLHPTATTDEGGYSVYDRPTRRRGVRALAPFLRMVREPKTEWWVHVRARDGREGWLWVDPRDNEETPVGNSDACG